MTDTNLSMMRGDTFAFGFEVEGLNALTSAYFTARAGYDGDIVFQKALNDGITLVEAGKYRVRVAPADTLGVDAGRYYYDLQIGANDDIYTILKGVLEIEQDVTY